MSVLVTDQVIQNWNYEFLSGSLCTVVISLKRSDSVISVYGTFACDEEKKIRKSYVTNMKGMSYANSLKIYKSIPFHEVACMIITRWTKMRWEKTK